MTELLPLSTIESIHVVRPLNERHIERLIHKIETLGLLRQYPLAVTADGILYGGNHKYEALKRLGHTEAYMDVGPPPNGSLTKAAIDLNIASEDALPMTFCCYAELIWQMLGEGKTQQAVAGELGWSRSDVSNYALLQKIALVAWNIVATTVRENGLPRDQGVVAEIATPVAMFTEGLLRALLPRKWDVLGKKDADAIALNPRLQIELVKWLAAGKDDNDRRFTKKQFSRLADSYHAQAAMECWLKRQLGEVDEDIIDEAFEQVHKGIYDDEWLDKKGPGPKLEKLLEATRDKVAKRYSVQLHLGDALDELAKIGDGAIDAIVTDPPYNISDDRIFTLSTQPDWNKNFGDWDNHEAGDFVAAMADWAAEFFRILKPGGTGFMFVGERWLNVAQSLFDAAGFEIRQTFFWCRSNPGPSVTKADFMPAMDYAIQFSKPGGVRTFNYPGDADGAGLNYQRFPICQGKERIVDQKGNPLHPTQKPQAVVAYLIDLITIPGELVLDPFMGVGTVPAVAKKNGRRAIGIEIDKKFFDAAEARVLG
jgi:DNA modification methylase